MSIIMQIVHVRNKSVQFDKTRDDWCLCYTNTGKSGHVDCRPRKQSPFWVPSTYVVWIIEFKEVCE